MYETGKLVQLIEMNRYRLHVFVSESRWTKSGKLRTSSIVIVLNFGRKMIYIVKALQSS